MSKTAIINYHKDLLLETIVINGGKIWLLKTVLKIVLKKCPKNDHQNWSLKLGTKNLEKITLSKTILLKHT